MTFTLPPKSLETSKDSPDDALIGQNLLWPPTEPPLMLDVPPMAPDIVPDFLSIRQLSIHDRIYDVKAVNNDEVACLRMRRNYWIVPFEGAKNGELALLREQARPDQAKQLVVVSEPTQRHVWIDRVESTDNFTRVHIIGSKREWVIRDLSLDQIELTEPRIIAILEAILIPAVQSVLSNRLPEPNLEPIAVDQLQMAGEVGRLPDLLRALRVDRNHTAIQFSLEAERLCRLHQYRPAIEIAESAVQLVRTDPWLLGETLLYLSYARLSSDLPEQVRQATRDCDRAIRALGLSPYNYAIANLIRGQMELQVRGTAGRSNALNYFQRANDILMRINSEKHESRYDLGQHAAVYAMAKAQIIEASEPHVPSRQLGVFLCHSSEDKTLVREHTAG